MSYTVPAMIKHILQYMSDQQNPEQSCYPSCNCDVRSKMFAKHIENVNDMKTFLFDFRTRIKCERINFRGNF